MQSVQEKGWTLLGRRSIWTVLSFDFKENMFRLTGFVRETLANWPGDLPMWESREMY